MKFLGPIVRKEELEILILTGQNEGQARQRKQRIAYLVILNN